MFTDPYYQQIGNLLAEWLQQRDPATAARLIDLLGGTIGEIESPVASRQREMMGYLSDAIEDILEPTVQEIAALSQGLIDDPVDVSEIYRQDLRTIDNSCHHLIQVLNHLGDTRLPDLRGDISGQLERHFEAMLAGNTDDAAREIVRILGGHMPGDAQQAEEMVRLTSQGMQGRISELRTPLNSIIGFSRVILHGIDGPVPPHHQPVLEGIRLRGMFVLNILNDLLDMIRLEGGLFNLNIEEISLAELVEELQAVSFQRRLNDPAMRLAVDVDVPPRSFRADRVLIQAILRHLVNESTPYARDHAVTVRIGHDEEQDVLRFDVMADTDVWPDAAVWLFEPFNRPADEHGSRLGGVLARGLIDLHHGTLEVVSTLDEPFGLSFTIPY